MKSFSKNSVESFRDRPEFHGWLVDFANRLVTETEDASKAVQMMNESSLNHHVGVWGQSKWMRRLNIINGENGIQEMTGELSTSKARQDVMDKYYAAIDQNPSNAGIPPQFRRGWIDGISSVVIADGLRLEAITPPLTSDFLADNVAGTGDVFSIENASRRVNNAYESSPPVPPIISNTGLKEVA